MTLLLAALLILRAKMRTSYMKAKKSPNTLTSKMDGIGTVRFKRSRLAQHLNIRVKPFSGVQVSVPIGMSYASAVKLVRNKASWIQKSLRRAQEAEQRAVIYDGTKPLKTRFHSLQVAPTTTENFSYTIMNGQIIVRYPGRLDLAHADVQEVIRLGMTEAYRIEAKAYLPKRLDKLAAKHGFEYRKGFIKNHRSRWGSCSSQNNINLSLHLMRLPDELIDYVILHELVHTKIKNHSREFWSALKTICGDVQLLKKQLKEHETPDLV